ncbi:leucine-rich repeat-containing protein 17 [Tachyglossus aculeatus]|uniref:leucine-rich repeat-containing protein 17 n=1 Tax=Tachyglossus aculeatus TaxID=9261 RepID=UPI0018F66CB4|nr:leucine-rich repeat-containing protein 17 [Tachyglossus aculeatus]XP_038597418.1 leucine-rich repeat-containing protein 17 [Tachyglossus aculeatus]XP_038597419.1 leucine-rich repeat-containing protein 17 [Tachyglossus aculeatus]XP_038597420.1 leucine-rich repeat-containing protein 17 [Tachyglossus aculeatus]
MQALTIAILLFFCKAAELRKTGPGTSRSKAHHGRVNGERRAWSPVKRYAPGLPCDIYTYLHEKYLDCQERRLVYVLAGWPEDLIHMLLARNKIRTLKNGMFARFRKLKSLDLQQNDISKIETDAFFGLSRLTTLLLQHNRIKVLTEEVFIYTPLLNYLRLYDNPWRCTCEMETLVTMLQVPRNRNLGNYAKCEGPEDRKDQKLKELRAEELCNEDQKPPSPRNQVAGKPPVIKPDVDSSLCHIYVFPIQTLDCKRRELRKIPTNIPPDIVKLDLSNNKISQLRPKEFEDAHELKRLNLSSNGIEFIDPAAFSGLTHLEELDLTNNSLQNFDYGVLEDLYFLKILWLKDNPWRCDYNIHYLYYWLRHHYNVHYNGLECKAPKEYKGWFVGKYVRSYFEECPKDLLPSYPDQDPEEEEWDKIHKEHIAKTQGVRITVIG